MSPQPNFAIFYASDAFSTAKKIMGRQNAGRTLMMGVARRWPDAELHGFGPSPRAGEAMTRQLRGYGHRGPVRWRGYPGDATLERLGAVYYPAPPTRALAHARNSRRPDAYSLFGVTHTISSSGGMDLVAEMALPPFQPWDALICTSGPALAVVRRLQDDLRDWHRAHMGATRFNDPQLPVIPLGVDAPAFAFTAAEREQARAALGVAADEVAFLSAGRLTFHAKANPAPVYLALEAAARRAARTLVCIETGVAPNAAAMAAYVEARARLAPSVRFITADGAVEDLYRRTWAAADVFVSMSDNIQETFGLTPVEAMAASLPALVSDWDGYKDTVRDGVDGYRIPTALPPPGSGRDLALRHALETDTYDYFIGRVSMATRVDVGVLADRMVELADSPDLRRRMGQAGRARVEQAFDWPLVLDRYVELADELAAIRRAADGAVAPMAWPSRPDPFDLFAGYATAPVRLDHRVAADAGREAAVRDMLTLGVARYVLEDRGLSADLVLDLHRRAAGGDHTVRSLLEAAGGVGAVRMRALMWLHKLDLVRIDG